MHELQVFDNPEFGKVRVVDRNGEAWFVAADVCRVLELSNPTMAAERLDEDEKAKFNLGLPGSDATVINEAGLYSLVLSSRKPQAKTFKRWITHEVIPAIHKHGAYMTPDTIENILNDPDTVIRLATRLKEERAKCEALEAQAESNRPKVLFADAVAASHTSILIGELAKLMKQNGVGIGQNRLFAWLRENGYLIRRKGCDYNMPTQKSMELGLFEVKERTINNPDGSSRIIKTPKVTGRGQQYFINKFLETEVQVG